MVNKRVFIVEDDPLIAELIEWRLKAVGYPVCNKVQTGEEAIDYCRRFRPDVVLMDIALGGKVDGIEAARKIKNDFNIPVIFLTAHTDNQCLERAKQIKPDGFIKKPFDDDDLRIQLSFIR